MTVIQWKMVRFSESESNELFDVLRDWEHQLRYLKREGKLVWDDSEPEEPPP